MGGGRKEVTMSHAVMGLGAWACFGMTLGVLIRSTPIALAVGIGWTGPIEHIIQEAWSTAGGVFPGLLLEAMPLGAPRMPPTPESSR
jgi:ABC-2 type transport system permease protein